MGTYASGTQVSSDRSVLEISKTVRRYGADQFAFMEGTGTAAVAFVMHNRQVEPQPPIEGPACSVCWLRHPEGECDR